MGRARRREERSKTAPTRRRKWRYKKQALNLGISFEWDAFNRLVEPEEYNVKTKELTAISKGGCIMTEGDLWE